MATKYSAPILVMNIKRQYFAEILAQPRRKWVEYRDMSKYWERRLAKVGKPPLNLRLLNGMTPPVPVATVRVTKVIRRKKGSTIELHLGRVLSVKHCNGPQKLDTTRRGRIENQERGPEWQRNAGTLVPNSKRKSYWS